MRAHGARAPDAQSDTARIRAGFAQVPLDQLGGQLLTDAPRGLAGHAARVDGVEVAPGGQHVGHAARGGAARPGGDVLAVERVQEVLDLVLRRYSQLSQELVGDELERAQKRWRDSFGIEDAALPHAGCLD